MNYFVTGATGFIGRRLVERLLQRGGTVYFLVRDQERDRLDQLRTRWNADETSVIPVVGDLTQANLGVSEQDIAELGGKIHHLFHLAAIYDLTAGPEIQHRVNIEGTRNAVKFAEALGVGCFHLTSSIAAAGLYDGIFREDMFEEAEGLDDPYYRTKHDSEGIVRAECTIPWRVYRPGIVVGDSRTGAMDKIDGPYYFFKFIQKLRQALPPWFPAVGIEGGRINVVPVDFVVEAMDYIAHTDGEDGGCFHLTDPSPPRIGDLLNIFARAAHAPQMALRLNARMFEFMPMLIRQGLAMLPPVKRISHQILDDLGVPASTFKFVNYPTRFDSRETQRVLADSGIEVPRIEEYAWRLWDYWERHLDPDLFIDRSLNGKVRDRVVMVTGASSGIGKATAIRIGRAGAKVILVARGEDKLLETQEEIERKGGTAFIYSADLSSMESCDELINRVIQDHGGVDILVNNAGRSIRRAVAHSYDRFHDFKRTMQLNYFGCLRLTLGFLPGMTERRKGQVINISSIGVLSKAPRFSAYVASKSALDAFSACAASEFADTGVSFTTINMPLVRTPMIAPTKMYQSVPTLSPEEAAELVVDAITRKPTRIATRTGTFAALINAVAPKLAQTILNASFRLFPESAAAHGEQAPESRQPTAEQIAFTELTRGIHW